MGIMVLIAYLCALNVWNPQGILTKTLSTGLAFMTAIALLLLTGKKSILAHLYLFGGGTALAARTQIFAVSRCLYHGLCSPNVLHLNTRGIRRCNSLFDMDYFTHYRD